MAKVSTTDSGLPNGTVAATGNHHALELGGGFCRLTRSYWPVYITDSKNRLRWFASTVKSEDFFPDFFVTQTGRNTW
jgi:hypothetical protein